jgi:hypothetical protein
VRRRRNPTLAGNSLLTWGMIAIGGYVLIKYILPMIQGIGQAGATAVNAVTTPIANLFPGTSPQVNTGSTGLTVLFPDGSSIPVNQINMSFVNGQAQFTYNGALYALTPQVNGVYNAIAL